MVAVDCARRACPRSRLTGPAEAARRFLVPGASSTCARARRSRLRDLLPTPQEFDVERLLKNPAVGLHSVSMGLRRRDIAELYDRRYVGFRNAAATITGSYESAADVVQEAFAEALVQRRRFRGDRSPEAWVWRIVMRTANRERGRRIRETPTEMD